MRWVARGGFVIVAVALWAADAHSQSPGAPIAPGVETSSADEPICESKSEPEASVGEFSQAVDRHARVAELTRELEERDRATFEESVDRHARLVELTRRLGQAHEAEQRRQFEEKVSRYVEKREFLQRLLDDRNKPPRHVPPTLTPAPESWAK